MINKQFQVEVRIEVKKAKQRFLQTSHYPKTCRHWNLNKVQLEGLENFIKKRSYMTNEEIECLIRKNPSLMSFYNYCIDMVPNVVDVLRVDGYNKAFELIYQNKQEKNCQQL